MKPSKYPFDLKNDARMSLNFLQSIAPVKRDDVIVDIKDTDKPDEFDVILKTRKGKKTLRMIKNQRWSTWWIYEFEGKKLVYPSQSKTDVNHPLVKALQEYLSSDEEALAHRMNHFDFTYQMSDDHRSYRSGEAGRKEILDRLNKMSSGSKSKIERLLNKEAKKYFGEHL